MLERDLVKKIKTRLESDGWTVFKHYGSPYSVKGFPDLFGATNTGRFFAIEVKVPGRKPDTHQLAFIQYLQEKDIISFWVDSLEKLNNELSTLT